ncbi:hypothetical protein ACN08N_08190 [Photobacterium leiognathi subsp. mandapamensis]|uniref:hypothetical protein n=1 Tax=Photobacterium leiognathi TaxID=553611 RepID=UPI003AF3D21C
MIFDEFGIIPKLVRGTKSAIHEDFGSHVWLEIDDLVVDITMDQFNTYGFDFPPVYIGNISEFHCSFTRAVEQDARHTESRYKSVLNSIYEVVTKGLES